LPFGYGGTAVPELVFLAKIFAVFFFFIMARLAIPRVRIDQILNVGWKVLMPLSVINLLLVVVMQTGGLI
jgi:NADH-quinone oxidoreductase subunit H